MKLPTASKNVSLASTLVLLACAGCAGHTEKESQPAAAASTSTTSSQSAPHANAATATPKDNVAPATTTTAASTALTAGGIVCRPPSEWIVEQPTSAMRKAQLRLPKVGGDAEDASLVVFFFGGQGGTPQANLDRWASQFEQPDGKSSQDALQSSQRKVAGMDVHDADLAGTYVAETFPGSGQRVRKENWRMLASIVEAPSGPHYLKLVGPAATVAHWEAAYRRFVGEITPAP